MSQSSRLRLPYLMPQQAQKHLTHNEALRLLDVLVQTSVVSADRADEPTLAEEGDLYILPASRSGARWAAMAPGALALRENGAFVEIEPAEGQIAYVGDRKALMVYAQGAWTHEPFAPRSSATFAVNAEPSGANRLTVAADAELLTHDDRTPGTGDARKIVNKAATGRTASVLFQTGFSGRAEFGLVGNDDLSLRVSADGATFRDALRVGAADGRVAVARAGPAVCALDVGGPVRVGAFAKAALPPASSGAGQIVFVPDEAGGAVLAFSDGAAWRRVTDRAVVS